MVVWTNGCFDILHRGHIEMLEYARSLGNHLVVGIDKDERVKESKGDSRPINTFKDRAYVLHKVSGTRHHGYRFGLERKRNHWLGAR